MKTITIIAFLCFSFFTTAQVGVGNTDPKSTLDISASSTTSPTNEDGILIPRIDNFPSTNPTVDQDGMMVFATGNGTPTKGFYYWDNGSAAWVSILGTKNTLDEAYDEGGTGLGRIITADSGPVEIQGGDGLRIDSQNFNNLFYVRGDNDRIGFNTINPSSMIDIQSTGNGSVTNPVMELNTLSEDGIQINLTGDNSNIGGNLDGVYVVDNSSSSGVSTRTKAYSARMNGISTQTNHDVRVYEAQITNASNYIGNVYGFYSQNLSTNNGQQYGILNSISNSGNGTHYGAYNSLTGSGSGNKYGVYSNISSSAGGTHYGVYSYTPSVTGYAGYFIGRTSLGNATTNRYLMPATDGTAGQVMTTDGAGNVTFQDISSEDSDWHIQGSASSPTSINDNIFTQGNVAIGNTSSSGKTFYVETNPSINSTSISNVLTPVSSGLVKGIENSATLNGTTNAYLLSNSIGGNSNGSSIQAIRNSFSGSGSGTKTGMYNFFTFGFSGTARGVVNYFNNTGIDGATGITNTFDTTNPSSYNTGVYNQAFSTHSSSYLYGNRTFFSGASVSNEAYGTYNVVSTTGTDYGVYSRADNNSTDYAAFFSGRVSVGNDPALNRYFLPGNDGTAGQVMTTDGAGNVSFQDATINTDNQAIDNIALVGTVLGISLDNDGVAPATVDLASLQDGTGTDDQQIDNFDLVGNTLGLSIEDDGQPVQTVNLNNLSFNVNNFSLLVVYRSLIWTHGGTGYEKLPLDFVAIDTQSEFNTPNNRFIANTTGYYQINATFKTVNWPSVPSDIGLAVYKNGTLFKEVLYLHELAGQVSRNLNCLVQLNASDYIEFYIYTTFNGLLMDNNPSRSWFEIQRIR
ncbi:MAG: beta strand repeat-containing protein [Winogradskyella sp.]|jgi:hypothetical protein